MNEEYVFYRINIGFGEYVDAIEELEVEAPVGLDADELLAYIRENNSDDLFMLLEVGDITDNEDGTWSVDINFAGYIGANETYEVVANDVDEAETLAEEEALWDFTIEYFEVEE